MLKYCQFLFCPRCSSKNIEFCENKAVKCIDCDFVYFHNTSAAVASIIEKDKKILFCRRALDPSKGKLDLPGGFVDYNESLEQALKRELKEELNLEIKNIKYFASLPNIYEYKTVTYFPVDVFFISNISDDSKEISAADDVESFLWIDIKSINFDDIAFKSVRKIIHRYRQLHLY